MGQNSGDGYRSEEEIAGFLINYQYFFIIFFILTGSNAHWRGGKKRQKQFFFFENGQNSGSRNP